MLQACSCAKVTPPNFDPILKPIPTYSCLKYTSTTYESQGLILETPIFN